MTKKLEELLNLPESQEIVQEEQAKSEAQDKQQEQKAKSIQAQKNTMRDIAEFDKIAAALPKVDGLGEMGDTELDDISNNINNINLESNDSKYLNIKELIINQTKLINTLNNRITILEEKIK